MHKLIKCEADARRFAWAISFDAGNRSMRKAGRRAWSRRDQDAATDAFYRAMRAFGYPCPETEFALASS